MQKNDIKNKIDEELLSQDELVLENRENPEEIVEQLGVSRVEGEISDQNEENEEDEENGENRNNELNIDIIENNNESPHITHANL